MIKILDSKNKNFDKTLDALLSKRKNEVQLNSVSVIKIIKDVKKNGDKALSPFFLTSLIILITETELS